MLRQKYPVGETRTPAAWTAGQTIRWDVPLILGQAFIAFFIRIAGVHTIGTANATSIANAGMQRLIRGLKVYADYKDAGGDRAIRSYTARGVNDAAAGRTASYAGQQLAQENLLDGGTPIEQTDPVVGVGANAVDFVLPIRFERPGTRERNRTLLAAHELKSLIVELDLGIADTIAAADDTDLAVHPATSTAALVANVNLSAEVLTGVPLNSRFDIRRVRTAALELLTSDALRLDLGEKAYYRRLGFMCTDDDVLSDARVTHLSVDIDKGQDVIKRQAWQDLQGDAKHRYSIETWLAGHNVIDFRGILSTRRASTVDLRCVVPAGAAVADDRLFATVEELVPRGFNNMGRGERKRRGAVSRRQRRGRAVA